MSSEMLLHCDPRVYGTRCSTCDKFRAPLRAWSCEYTPVRLETCEPELFDVTAVSDIFKLTIRFRQLCVGFQSGDSPGHVLSNDGSELESLSRSSACKPDVLEVRVSIDDEVARGAEFIMTRSRFQEGCSLEQKGKRCFTKSRASLSFSAIEYTLAQVRVCRRVAAHAYPKIRDYPVEVRASR